MFARGVKRFILVVWLVVWASLGWADVAPWPQYQHDGQHTGRSLYPGPGNSSLKWHQWFTSGCSVVIGPNKTIYVASDKLYALTQNGADKWNLYLGGKVCSPLIGSDGLIYAATSSGDLFCIRDDETKATIIWEKKLSDSLFTPTLSLDENTIYVGSSDGSFYLVNSSNGSIKGSFTTDFTTDLEAFTTPAISISGNIYFASYPKTGWGKLYALNSEGNLLWSYDYGTQKASSPSIGPNGTVYISAGGILHAIDPGTGTRKWKYYRAYNSSPAIGTDGTLYLGSGYYDGTKSLHALYPEDGSIKWQYPEEGSLGDYISYSPVIDLQGKIYFGVGGSSDATKTVYCLNPNGTFNWKFNTYDKFWKFPSLALSSDGILYAGTDYHHLYALGSEPVSLYIKGYIKDTEDLPLKGVVVNLYGDASGSYTTGSDGFYEFLNLAVGEYTVIPKKSGYSFSPSNYFYPSLSESKENQDFTATHIGQGAYNELGDLNRDDKTWWDGEKEKWAHPESDIYIHGYEGAIVWYWPWYEDENQFWWCTTPKAPEGKINSQAVKYRHYTYIWVDASLFDQDGEGHPQNTLYLTIRYKDDVRAPQDMKADFDYPGVPVYSYNGSWILQDYIGGNFDHRWKTIQFEIDPSKLKVIEEDTAKGPLKRFKFKIGDGSYKDSLLGELPLDKVKLADNPETPEFEEDCDGFWPESPQSRFGTLSETCEYIPDEGPFFPYGIFAGTSFVYDQGTGTMDTWQIMEDNNLNCYVISDWDIDWYNRWHVHYDPDKWYWPGGYVEPGFDEHLQLSANHNLKVLPVFGQNIRAGWVGEYRYGSERACLDYLEQVMRDHKDNPNIPFWYLIDEWDHEYGSYGRPHLFAHQLSRRQRLADPNRPGFMLAMGFMGLTEWQMMAEDADVLSCDKYPSDYDNVETGLNRQAQKLDQMRQAVGDTRPLIMTVEAVDYPPEPLGRTLTKEEMIAQAYISIAHGAVGILYFGFPHPKDPRYDKYGGVEGVWDGIHQVGYEILKAPDRLAPAILPPSVTLDIMGEKGIVTTGTEKMHWIYKQKENGDKYLITLNGSSQARTTTWHIKDIGTGTKELIVLFETRTVTAISGTFTDTYQGYERHIYKLPAETFFINGSIKDKQGSPLGSVTVTLSGGSNATTTTNSSGYYQFLNLLPNTYYLTPTHPQYTFSPPQATLTITDQSLTQDFTGSTLSPAVITLVSPTHGPVGTIVTIKGGNFYSTETIRISFGNTITIVLAAAENGSFTTTFTVDDQGFGTITIIAYGLDSEYIATGYFVIPPPEYFKIGTISSPQIAGQGFSINITAYNKYGDIVTNFKGTATLTDITDTLIPHPPSFIPFKEGIWQGTVTITKSGTTAITAHSSLPTDNSISGTSNQFYVNAGTPTKFLVYPEEELKIPAGGTVAITAQLIDAYNNPVGSSGISCNLEVIVISGTSGILSTITTTTNKSGQIATITYFVSPHAGDRVKLSINNYQLSIINYSGTITTIPADLDHFTFDPIGTQTVGVNFPITITAKDRYENTVDSFQGTTTLTDLTNSLNPKQTLAFVAGSWTGSGSITVAGTTNITAGYKNIRGTSTTFLARGGTLTQFVISPIATQTAGVGFNITIQAKDSFGNIADGFTGTATLTDITGTLIPHPPSPIPFTSGIWQGTVTITKSGTTAITAHYYSIAGTSNFFLVQSAGLHHFSFATITTQTAGVGFTITITAKDSFGNIADGFTGTATLTDITGTLIPHPSSLIPFKEGLWQGTVTITMSGTTAITAHFISGTSNLFFVQSAALHQFRFAPITDQTAGEGFNITIIANDAYQNTVTTYNGTNTLTDTTGSIIPNTTSNFINGVLKDFQVTIFISSGNVIIHTSNDGIVGTSNTFKVTAGKLDHFNFDIIPSPQIAGKNFQIVIKAVDKDENIIDNWIGKVSLSDTSNTILPTSTTNFIAGIWQGNVRITKAGTTSIFASGYGKYGTSNTLKVIAGDLDRIDIEPKSVELKVDESKVFTTAGYDEYGNEVSMEHGAWSMEQEIGRLENIIGSRTTFIAGTEATSGILYVKCDTIIGTANIIITPGELSYIKITPPEVTIEVGGTCTFTAKGYDKYGNEKEVGNGKWEVGSKLGELTNVIGTKTTFVAGTKQGKGILTCRVEQIQGSASITVRSGRVNRFDFDPIKHQIINTNFGIKVTAQDRYGNLASDYNQTGSLTTNFGQIKPANITFYNGIAIGTVTIETNQAAPDVKITIRVEAIESQSNDFAVLYDDASNVKVEEGNLKIDIKSQSVSKDYYLTIDKPGLDEDEIKIANLQMNHYNPGFCLLTDTIIRIAAKDGDKKPIEGNFGTRTTRVIIYYHQPPKNVAEETLKLYILDEESIESRWVEVARAQVLVGSNFIYGDIPHFGTFILIGEGIPAGFDGVVVYPNPFKPSRGDENIVFEGLPEDTQIRIYDISGSLVKEEEHKRATWIWDVRDNYGKKVDSGIYIYVLTTGDGKKKIGKLAIIR
ncbi:MAG: PQQ-binding-like beta-propeller repeat protein [bacterium]